MFWTRHVYKKNDVIYVHFPIGCRLTENANIASHGHIENRLHILDKVIYFIN